MNTLLLQYNTKSNWPNKKKQIYGTILKNIVTHGNEVWPLKGKNSAVLAKEMDFWSRSAGRSRKERVMNERMKGIMGVKH